MNNFAKNINTLEHSIYADCYIGRTDLFAKIKIKRRA